MGAMVTSAAMDSKPGVTIESPRDLPHPTSTSSRTNEQFGDMAVLSSALRHLRVHHELLPPGRRSSRPHHHTLREECVFVLAGEVELVVGEQTRIVRSGEIASIAAGPPHHVVRNAGERSAELLVFSASPGDDEVVYE